MAGMQANVNKMLHHSALAHAVFLNGMALIPPECLIAMHSSVRSWDSWIQMFQQVSAGNIAPNWGLFPHGQNWHISTGLRQCIHWSSRGEIEEWKPPTMGVTQQHAHCEGSSFILCRKPSHRLVRQLWVRWLSAKVAFSPPSRQPWGQRGCMIASVCYITLTWWRILSWGLK